MLKGQNLIDNPYNLSQQARDRYGAEFCNWFYEQWMETANQLRPHVKNGNVDQNEILEYNDNQ